MKKLIMVLFLAASVLHAGDSGKQSKGQNKKTQPTSWLGRYNLRKAHPKQFRLPKRLSEASGLAMSDDGRLFSHNDELGVVYQVDYTTGKIVKQFSLGTITLRGDFEDIAIKGEMMYLVSSNGTVYEFRDGKDGGRVPYEARKTFLTTKNDVEGLVYDRESDCLLLACKDDPGKGYSNFKAVYAFSLKDHTLNRTPRLLIPLEVVAKKAFKGEFNPSGIAKHPKSGTYFIISSNGRSIIEMSANGTVLAQEDIPNKVNKQPEGITFAPDLTMIICDDGQGGAGMITLYPLNH